jgi:hypothetical protein
VQGAVQGQNEQFLPGVNRVRIVAQSVAVAPQNGLRLESEFFRNGKECVAGWIT